MESEVLASILSLHGKVDGVVSDVKTLSSDFNDLDCKVNNNKIKNLEKVVYGMVKIILVAFVIGVVALVVNSGGSHKQAVADTQHKIIKKAIK